MKVQIEDGCISCGLCVSTCPEVFQFGNDEKATIVGEVKKSDEPLVTEAAEGCPVAVIRIEE